MSFALLNVTPGVQQLERAGEEVDASASASAILLSIVVQVVIGLLLFALFAFLRPRIPSVYAPVEEFSKRPTIDACDADGGDELERAKCFAWRYNLPWRDEASEQEVLERGGLDALLLLRMMRLCFEASLLATICAGGLQSTRAVIDLVTPNPKMRGHRARALHQHQLGLPLEYNFMIVPCLFVWALSLCLYALVYFHVRGHAPPCGTDAARTRLTKFRRGGAAGRCPPTCMVACATTAREGTGGHPGIGIADNVTRARRARSPQKMR